MRLTSLLVIFLATSGTNGIYECCPGENLLSVVTSACSSKENISLECNGIPLAVYNASQFKDFNYLLADNGTLTDVKTNSEITYCHSHPHEDSTNESNHIYIICYEHTGSFEDNKIRLGAILGYISVAFTILTIAVYAMVPTLLDLQGICIIHILVGLVGGYTFLGVIQLAYLDNITCDTCAFLTYFWFMYLFFWLNTLSFHIWRTTVYPRLLSATVKWAVAYHIFAIGGVFVFLMFVLTAHYSTSEMWNNIKPGIGVGSCWFQSMRETMIFFYGPISVLLFFNVVFYLWTLTVLFGQAKTTRNKILTYRLKLCVRLFIIMGITWIFEIITTVLYDPHMSFFGKLILFFLDLFNILQGLLIFLVLVVFRKKVRRALASKNLCNIQFPNSWKYLEDEEMESHEYRTNCIVAEYTENGIEIKR